MVQRYKEKVTVKERIVKVPVQKIVEREKIIDQVVKVPRIVHVPKIVYKTREVPKIEVKQIVIEVNFKSIMSFRLRKRELVISSVQVIDVMC